jgi:uncharacterized protein (TIGR03066 family)
MKSKTRKSKQAFHAPPKAPLPPGASVSKWRWVLMAVAIAVVAAASFAVFEFILPGKIPPELVGEWRVVGSNLSGMTVEFRRNGGMTGKAIIDGKESVLEGHAEVTGNTLRTTTTNPYSGRSDTGIQTIISLSEMEFVTEDEKGMRITMKRVR